MIWRADLEIFAEWLLHNNDLANEYDLKQANRKQKTITIYLKTGKFSRTSNAFSKHSSDVQLSATSVMNLTTI